MRLWVASILAAGCTPTATELAVVVPREHEQVVRDFVDMAGHPGLVVTTRALPEAARAVVLYEDEDPACAGCYRLEVEGRTVRVHGSDRLGLQYGLAAVLEEMGFRFFHPNRPRFPVEFGDVDGLQTGELVVPEIDRRGLHLHTLHPIEGLYDFWEPGEESLARAKQVVDWVVKNRGNHLQWVALDDVVREPGRAGAWALHTREIVDYAHERGLTIGLGVQLFGSGNLQQAFDLVDGELDPADVSDRLAVLGSARPDLLNLSFGEFSGEDPEAFVETANQVVAQMSAVVPSADVTTVIHVGNYDDLRVSFRGEEMLYYFLAQYIEGADPWVHSVMYYNLFEDAGLAYLHEEFDEHRDFLLDGLRAGEPIGYFPESAYWVAFDNSVPVWLPLYVRSRHTDIARIRDEGLQLEDHVLFSSGWEWGYWQNDYATLRLSHTLPDDWRALYREMFAPWGEEGRALADAATDLADLQHAMLLEGRLAAYLAGRDAIIDLGDQTLGILSQPDRPRFSEIVAMTPEERAEVQATVDALGQLATETEGIGEAVDGLGHHEPFFLEVRDGIEIDALRARFAQLVFQSAVHLGDGDTELAEARLAEAEGVLDDAARVVARRHDALHWTGGDRIVAHEDENASIYRFGYLGKADELCYWERERVQLANLVRGTNESVPPCT